MKGELLLKSSWALTHPRAQHRGSCLKGAQVFCEENSFPNLKELAGEAGACWDTLWGQKLVGPIFELSFYCASEHQYLLEGSFYPHLVFWVLWLPPGGTPWLLGSGGQGTGAPGSPGAVTFKRQFLAGYHPQGTGQTADWNTPQSFQERALFACPGALAWGAGICSGTLLGAYGSVLREQRPTEAGGCNLCILSLPCSSLPVSPRTLAGAPIFATALRRHLYIA